MSINVRPGLRRDNSSRFDPRDFDPRNFRCCPTEPSFRP